MSPLWRWGRLGLVAAGLIGLACGLGACLSGLERGGVSDPYYLRPYQSSADLPTPQLLEYRFNVSEP